MKELNPSKVNYLKIEKLSQQTGLTMDDLASFSPYNRTDDYLSLSLSLGFDLDRFFDLNYEEIDFKNIALEGGYLSDFFTTSKGIS